MRVKPIATLISHAFAYVIKTSRMYNIDESHALKHSMEVYNYANKIYEHELIGNPILEKQKETILVSSILHDMCDKKYMSERQGIMMIKKHMIDYMPISNLEVMCNIISTMSYSKVKKNGYPKLGENQLAYHIVREADLLCSYDVDRTIIYGIYRENLTYDQALKRATELFQIRMLKYIDDDLFVTDYSKKEAIKLHVKSDIDLDNLKNVLFY
jgi:HD superfamily phosphodiesterase